MSVHIHSPEATTVRRMRKCTSCKMRRRFIIRRYDWYDARMYCGGCGQCWVQFEGRQRTGKKERVQNRIEVARVWAGEIK